MNVAELEEIEYLLKNASPDWCVYSEPEVGMPPSLFSGTPGTVDFQPIEPLQCHDLLLARLAPYLARRVIAAEKLAEEVRYDLSCWPDTMAGTLRDVLQAYEATK